MGTISVSLPNDGETADAVDYNVPITTIVNEINGNLDNSNLSDTAAIDASKLAGDVLKPHYNALFFSTGGTAGGQVVSNSLVNIDFDASDTDNDNGITATTGTGAYLTVTRAGLYNMTAHINMSDGTTTTEFGLFFGLSFDNGSTYSLFRQGNRYLTTAQGQVYSAIHYLPASTRIKLAAITGSGGGIRLASPTDSSFNDRYYLGPKLSVVEMGRQ